METLLGEEFVNAKGEKLSLSQVVKPDTKAVGIYFSAHWCGPCRGFTPQLAKAYTTSLKEKGLEIVFVSSDRDENSFKEYLKEMPWVALPFSDRNRKNSLSSKFKVQGIPTFVLIDPKDGQLITDSGRSAIMNDPTGIDFPWRPKTTVELFSNASFLTKSGNNKTWDELKECSALGIYFSASWCGPCRGFTPKLIETYNLLKQKDEQNKQPQRFEIVFISADRDVKSFKEYYAEMPWLTIDFDNQTLKGGLDERFKVEGIPHLVIINPKTGESINEDAVGNIRADPLGEDFPWAPKSCEILNAGSAGKIGGDPALFVFCEDDAKAKSLQSDIAAAVDVWKGNVEEGAVCHGDVCIPTGGKIANMGELNFFVCGTDPIVARVKELGKATGGVIVAILHFDGANYVHCKTITSIEQVTPMNLRKFVDSYVKGELTKIPLQLT